ncbi:hypothetical protein M2150_001017 [Lachnospiraceae bacterium PM6-15]
MCLHPALILYREIQIVQYAQYRREETYKNNKNHNQNRKKIDIFKEDILECRQLLKRLRRGYIFFLSYLNA